jgi:hypothetical protein
MTTQITLPELATGQYNAGLILKEDGTPDYWLIGLPGELEAATWQQAMDWAKEQGGDLPNRRELNLLRANARKEFKNDWYWSNETNESSWAWYQSFNHGSHTSNDRIIELRARAVRRLPI